MLLYISRPRKKLVFVMMFSPGFPCGTRGCASPRWHRRDRPLRRIRSRYFEQVDVVARGAAGAVGPHVGFDSDGSGGTDSLAELAGDAPLLAVGIPAQRMQPAEARRLRGLLLGILDRDLPDEEIDEGQAEALDELPQGDVFKTPESRFMGLICSGTDAQCRHRAFDHDPDDGDRMKTFQPSLRFGRIGSGEGGTNQRKQTGRRRS